jgi:hypothetical protein
VRLPRTAPPRVQLPSQIMTQMLRTKIIECNEHKQLIGGNAGRLLLLAWPRQATAHIIQRGGRSSPMSVGTTLVCVFHRRVHTRHPAVRIADERALVCPPGMCTLVTRRQCRGACRCAGDPILAQRSLTMAIGSWCRNPTSGVGYHHSARQQQHPNPPCGLLY